MTPGRLRPSSEHQLLDNRTRDVAVAVSLSAATAAIFLLVALRTTRHGIQNIDQSYLRTMASHRVGWLTAVARVFNVLGLVYVTLPIRVAIAVYLAIRRRWWHFAAFVGAMVVSEALIGTLKSVYDRARPAHSLVHTSGGSFPSGHAVAASVTVVAAVIALVPTGRARAVYGVGAALFAFLMGLSRAYLGAHWLSDAVAGVLLGTTVALVCALVVQVIRDRRQARSGMPLVPT